MEYIVSFPSVIFCCLYAAVQGLMCRSLALSTFVCWVVRVLLTSLPIC